MEEITGEFPVDKSTFIAFQSIIHSIPQLWKQKIKNAEDNNLEEYTNITINEQKYIIPKIYLIYIYKELVYRRIDKSKAYDKYSEKYEIGDEEWKRHYTAFLRLDVDNTAQELQYIILQNYVATNKLLYKMKIKPNPRCNSCNSYTQDTAHLFFESLDTKYFWLQLNDKLKHSGQMGVTCTAY